MMMIATMFESTSIVALAVTRSMLHMLWAGGLLYLVMKVLFTVLLSERQAEFRYFLSLFMLSAAAGSFFIILGQLYSSGSRDPSEVASLFRGTGMTLSSFVEDQGTPTHTLHLTILRAYVLGMFLFSLRWLIGCIRLEKLRHRGIAPDASEMKLINTLRARTGMGWNTRILKSADLQGPVVWGIFKPTILVPLGFFSNMPVAQVEALILHEIMHIRRFDHLVNALQSIVEVVFFFNPFIWMISREVRLEREKSIDDRVLGIFRSPGTYARALYALSQGAPVVAAAGIHASGDAGKPLLNRIKRILNIHVMKTSIKSKLLVISLTIVCFSGLVLLSGSALPSFDFSQQKPIPAAIASSDTIVNKVTTVTLSGEHIADTLTEEEWQQLKYELEKAHAELQAVNLDSTLRAIEEDHEALMIQLRENLARDQERMKAEIKRIDGEVIRKQIEEAAATLDSFRLEIDMDQIRRELNEAQKELEEAIREGTFENEEVRKQMNEALRSMAELDIEKIMQDVENSLADVDFDAATDFNMDMDIDIDIESIMADVEKSLEAIDVEEIRNNIEEAMKDIEKQMQAIDERNKEGKIKN